MDALEMFVLGRKLMKLAERALPAGEVPVSIRSVLIDVAANPASSISEITDRTGLLQSQVSAAVARLRELGAVWTESDPADGRRTLVWVTAVALRRAARRPSMPVDDVLAVAIGDGDAAGLVEVTAALEMLSRRLTPKARARIAAERAS